jgi:hypothetical protein
MRPLAVTVIGFYQILRGVLYALFGLSIVAFAGLAGKLASFASEGNAMQRYLGTFGHMAGLIVLVAAVFNFAAGYGLLQMQNWGRLLALLFSAVGLVLLIPFLRGHALPMIFAAINALTIFYLVLPPIKRAFHAEGKPLRMAA